MIDFWLAAGLLLLLALGFLLVPLLRARGSQPEQDRTALNVALYQERLAELNTQQAAGVLTAAQLESGQAEAARELLADTEGGEVVADTRLGRSIPLAAAILVPVLGLVLYLHYGASDQVELSREFAVPPTSMAQMTARLEQAVQMQPEAVEGVYILGRTYMAQNRPAQAAELFERAAKLSGRQPEVLGQWAQALYFAAGKKWSEQIQALTDEALLGDPKETTSLGLLGIAAFEGRDFDKAIAYWERLQATLPDKDPARTALQGGIERARGQLAAAGKLPVAEPAPARAVLKVQVALAPGVAAKVQPGDSVFVFARAVSGPPMPLAVKRLTVADLPAQVELADSDAMMPQLKLSNFPEVQLIARISRAGQPTQGEWLARGAPIASDSAAVQQLMIDSPDL